MHHPAVIQYRRRTIWCGDAVRQQFASHISALGEEQFLEKFNALQKVLDKWDFGDKWLPDTPEPEKDEALKLSSEGNPVNLFNDEVSAGLDAAQTNVPDVLAKMDGGTTESKLLFNADPNSPCQTINKLVPPPSVAPFKLKRGFVPSGRPAGPVRQKGKMFDNTQKISKANRASTPDLSRKEG